MGTPMGGRPVAGTGGGAVGSRTASRGTQPCYGPAAMATAYCACGTGPRPWPAVAGTPWACPWGAEPARTSSPARPGRTPCHARGLRPWRGGLAVRPAVAGYPMGTPMGCRASCWATPHRAGMARATASCACGTGPRPGPAVAGYPMGTPMGCRASPCAQVAGMAMATASCACGTGAEAGPAVAGYPMGVPMGCRASHLVARPRLGSQPRREAGCRGCCRPWPAAPTAARLPPGPGPSPRCEYWVAAATPVPQPG